MCAEKSWEQHFGYLTTTTLRSFFATLSVETVFLATMSFDATRQKRALKKLLSASKRLVFYVHGEKSATSEESRRLDERKICVLHLVEPIEFCASRSRAAWRHFDDAAAECERRQTAAAACNARAECSRRSAARRVRFCSSVRISTATRSLPHRRLLHRRMISFLRRWPILRSSRASRRRLQSSRRRRRRHLASARRLFAAPFSFLRAAKQSRFERSLAAVARLDAYLILKPANSIHFFACNRLFARSTDQT